MKSCSVDVRSGQVGSGGVAQAARRHAARWGVLALGAVALAASLALVPAAPAQAQDYPSKPVRLVNPYSPGGSTGVVARAISAKFQEQTGQSMVIDNKPGAGSNIGSDIVAKAAPDGYTVLLGTSSLAINPSLYKTMPFDPIKDLAPVMTLIRTPNVLAVHPSLPVKSVKDLIDYARANPGKLNYGSSGNGATNHMGMELFKSMAKVDLVHVPFKGGGEALQALLGGNIQVLLNPASTLVPHDKSGGLRIVAVGAPERVEGVDAPTVSEAGLPGFESGVWFALFVPPGTPAPIVGRLNTEMNLALKDKRVREILHGAGMQPVGGSPEQLRKLLAEDTVRWGGVIKTANIRMQ